MLMTNPPLNVGDEVYTTDYNKRSIITKIDREDGIVTIINRDGSFNIEQIEDIHKTYRSFGASLCLQKLDDPPFDIGDVVVPIDGGGRLSDRLVVTHFRTDNKDFFEGFDENGKSHLKEIKQYKRWGRHYKEVRKMLEDLKWSGGF